MEDRRSRRKGRGKNEQEGGVTEKEKRMAENKTTGTGEGRLKKGRSRKEENKRWWAFGMNGKTGKEGDGRERR